MMLTCLKKVIQRFALFVADPFRTEKNGALGGNGPQLSIVRKNVKKGQVNGVTAIIQKRARCLH